MIDRDSLVEKYEQMTAEDLLYILSAGSAYTDLAKTVAHEQLIKQGITGDEINKFLSNTTYDYSPEIRSNAFADIKLWQKLFLFFIWPPRIRGWVNNKFYTKHQILKVRKSNYYLVAGVSLFIISYIIYAAIQINLLISWAFSFVPAYLFDIGYNKNRQIKVIKEQLEKDEFINF